MNDSDLRSSEARRLGRRLFCVALVGPLAGLRRAAVAQSEPGRHPHASADVLPFVAARGAYAFSHPADWKVHETAGRVTIGADDGLVPTERGFRTVYGVIIAVVDDPEAARSPHDIEASTRAIVDGILERNGHQSISVPVRVDRPVGGAPAASAVLMGTSPVTNRGERAEVVCRRFGGNQILYAILVCPADAYTELQRPLHALRDSIRVPGK